MARLKPIEALGASEGQQLKRTMSWPHLVGLGVGAIVGTGIYTLIGTGANLAGPAVILSFAIAGLVCALVALAYAELATMMPIAGSAYTYSYAAIGEVPAWFVGWSLILEYSVVVATVAVGWSAYAARFLDSIGLGLPHALVAGPLAGGIVNLPAVFIVIGVAGALIAGTRESATINALLVVLKVLALLTFIALVLPAFNMTNLHPFMPDGFAAHVAPDGTKHGVMAAAAIIFFAFYGFDAVSTAAEEVKNPKRDLIIGILGSMAVCTLLYVLVAIAALGALPYTSITKSAAPLADVLIALGHSQAARAIEMVAVIALPTVILAFLFGQTRIFFVMARDRLLPERLARLSARGAPVAVTIGTAILVSVLAGLLSIDVIASIANAGTLAAFAAVALAMMVMRRKRPDLPRSFRTPLPWLVGPLAILGCLYLFYSLTHFTQEIFLAWHAIGAIVYLAYARGNSRLA